MTTGKKPKLAATVILTRPAERGFEVFLTRRPDSMPFLGGMYCFPGGTVLKEDYSENIQRRYEGLTPMEARTIAGAHFNPRQALGFWTTAVRELFEETGVLLTRPGAGPQIGNRLSELHRALSENSISFQELLQRENLKCDLANLSYFSHWQTPSSVPMRFDTRFFLTVLPENQTPLATSPEVVHSVWVTPDRALQLFGKNELPMIFPTFASLRTLADFDSLHGLLKEYRSPVIAG